MNSTVLPSFQFDMNCQGFAAARLTWAAYVDDRKLENSSALLVHPHVDEPGKRHDVRAH